MGKAKLELESKYHCKHAGEDKINHIKWPCQLKCHLKSSQACFPNDEWEQNTVFMQLKAWNFKDADDTLKWVFCMMYGRRIIWGSVHHFALQPEPKSVQPKILIRSFILHSLFLLYNFFVIPNIVLYQLHVSINCFLRTLIWGYLPTFLSRYPNTLCACSCYVWAFQLIF